MSRKWSLHAPHSVSFAIQCRTHIQLHATSTHKPMKKNKSACAMHCSCIFHLSCIASHCILKCINLMLTVLLPVADACALSLAVYSSDVSSNVEQLGSPPPIPVNALRNRAIALAATEVHVVHSIAHAGRMHAILYMLAWNMQASQHQMSRTWCHSHNGLHQEHTYTVVSSHSRYGCSVVNMLQDPAVCASVWICATLQRQF